MVLRILIFIIVTIFFPAMFAAIIMIAERKCKIVEKYEKRKQ